MTIRDLISKLGGPSTVGDALGVAAKAVSMWGSRDEIPGDYHVPVWRLAVKAGVAWAPPGADGLVLVVPAEEAPAEEVPAEEVPADEVTA